MENLILTTILALSITTSVHANEYVVTDYSVYDGDTITYTTKLLPNLVHTGKLRLLGIDTPEIRTKDLCEKKKGFEAKELLIVYLANKEITIRNLKNGKYAGRLLGELYADGKPVSEYMLSTGLAYKYFGGKRDRGWCR